MAEPEAKPQPLGETSPADTSTTVSDEAASPCGELQCSGWLIKRGGTIKSWKKRWFELSSNGDITYSENSSKAAIRTITAEMQLGVAAAADCATSWPANTPEHGCFGIRTDSRTFFAYGEVADGVKWRGCILASLSCHGAKEVIRKDALAKLHELLTEFKEYKQVLADAGVLQVLQRITESETVVAVREDARAVSKLFTQEDLSALSGQLAGISIESGNSVTEPGEEDIAAGIAIHEMRKRAQTAPASSFVSDISEAAEAADSTDSDHSHEHSEQCGCGHDHDTQVQSQSPSHIDDGSDSELPTDDTFDDEHGCEHYKRRCLLKAPCCGVFHHCRKCHDDGDCQHEMDRKAVEELKCLICGTEQPVAKRCIKCKTQFARYACLICRLFDSVDRNQYHCDGCGICRIGPKEKFKHCDRCNACLRIDSFDQHKCVDEAMDRNCPVCLENLNKSDKPVTSPMCGHLLHTECLHQLVQASTAKCPLCSRPLFDIQSATTASSNS